MKSSIQFSLSLGLFAKYPEAGKVKTRLAPLLGDVGAARFAHYLILNSLHKFLHGLQAGQKLVLWYDGGTLSAWCDLLGRAGVSESKVVLCSQSTGTLGQRMAYAMETQLIDSNFAMLVGADAVQLKPHHVSTLLESTRSNSHGLAFIPAHDGGYVAVCMNKLHHTVFHESIAWGTDLVAEQTRSRLAESGLTATWLPPLADIDEPEDYQQALLVGDIPADWLQHYGSEKWLQF